MKDKTLDSLNFTFMVIIVIVIIVALTIPAIIGKKIHVKAIDECQERGYVEAKMYCGTHSSMFCRDFICIGKSEESGYIE